MKKKKAQAVQKRSTQALSIVCQDKDSNITKQTNCDPSHRYDKELPGFRTLTGDIIKHIQAYGGKAELINNNRSCDHIANKSLNTHDKEPRSIAEIVSLEMVGKAKIIALINGTKVKIEVDPIGTNRTAEDLLMQNLIESSGDTYYVARDFSSFIDWYLEKFKIKNRWKIPYDTNISIRVCNRKLGQVINPILKSKGGKVL